MQTPLRNYHTHTWRCQHAVGTEEEYVQAAIAMGFDTLGFADHTPWPYQSGFISGMRMRLEQLDDYVGTVLKLREKYRGQIRILLGLECEAFPEYFGWLRDLKAARLDYIILGNHYDYSDEGDHRRLYPAGGFYFGRCTRSDSVIRYGERTLAGMRTGLYDYLAHPDLCMRMMPAFDADCRAVSRDICQAAREMGMPLEFNLAGFSRRERDLAAGWQSYPCADFWRVAADAGCKAIVGFDAHSPAMLRRMDLYCRATAILEGLGMEIVSEV